MPSLWTSGFSAANANGKAARNDGVKDGSLKTSAGAVASFIGAYLRRYGVAYLMMLLSFQLLAKSLQAKNVLRSRWLAVRLLLPIATLKPMEFIASLTGRKIGWLNENGAAKVASIVAVLLAAAINVLR